MIDLTSKDYSYTSLKVNEIERKLKKIKPDICELTSSNIINISLIVFAYLCEGGFIETEGDDLTIELYDDLLLIDVEDMTMQLKFKNILLNQIIASRDEKGYDKLFETFPTLKALEGDDS